MQLATTSEIEYLSAQGRMAEDETFIREMSRRLDALRRYDQHFSAADWRPRTHRGNTEAERDA